MVLLLTVSIFIMAEIITPLLNLALGLLPQPLALFISLGIQVALLTYFVLPWLTTESRNGFMMYRNLTDRYRGGIAAR
ncbi:MAG: hypothetical protein WCB91_09775 [Halobacteriota archaeon]